MSRGAGRALVWLVGLLATGITLRAAATGALAPPPLGSVDALAAWAERRQPAATAIALVRLIAEVAVWYVLAVSALHATSAALHVVGGHRLADALALPAVRRTVRAGLGLGLAAASSVGGRAPTEAQAVTVARAEAPLASHAQTEGRGTATMRPQVIDPAEPGVARMAPVPVPTTWTVVAGDSFWSIAEEVLADAWQRPPTDAEVDPFWRTLVERNRGRLVDPGDPDLIRAGQVFEVPPLPSAAS